MTDADTMQALDRIARALSRIEAVEQAAAARPAPVGADPALVERHERLRTRVRETLDRLDALIGEGKS